MCRKALGLHAARCEGSDAQRPVMKDELPMILMIRSPDMIKKTTLVLSLALAAALGSASASSAEAGPVQRVWGHGLDACPAYSLCLYQDHDFNGNSDAAVWVITDSITNLNDYGINDVASSAYLNEPDGGNWARLYDDTYYGGDNVRLYPGRKLDQLNSQGGYGTNGADKRVYLNDAITSVSIGPNE
jgi:hypothetical protein